MQSPISEGRIQSKGVSKIDLMSIIVIYVCKRCNILSILFMIQEEGKLQLHKQNCKKMSDLVTFCKYLYLR